MMNDPAGLVYGKSALGGSVVTPIINPSSGPTSSLLTLLWEERPVPFDQPTVVNTFDILTNTGNLSFRAKLRPEQRAQFGPHLPLTTFLIEFQDFVVVTEFPFGFTEISNQVCNKADLTYVWDQEIDGVLQTFTHHQIGANGVDITVEAQSSLNGYFPDIGHVTSTSHIKKPIGIPEYGATWEGTYIEVGIDITYIPFFAPLTFDSGPWQDGGSDLVQPFSLFGGSVGWYRWKVQFLGDCQLYNLFTYGDGPTAFDPRSRSRFRVVQDLTAELNAGLSSVGSRGEHLFKRPSSIPVGQPGFDATGPFNPMSPLMGAVQYEVDYDYLAAFSTTVETVESTFSAGYTRKPDSHIIQGAGVRYIDDLDAIPTIIAYPIAGESGVTEYIDTVDPGGVGRVKLGLGAHFEYGIPQDSMAAAWEVVGASISSQVTNFRSVKIIWNYDMLNATIHSPPGFTQFSQVLDLTSEFRAMGAGSRLIVPKPPSVPAFGFNSIDQSDEGALIWQLGFAWYFTGVLVSFDFSYTTAASAPPYAGVATLISFDSGDGATSSGTWPNSNASYFYGIGPPQADYNTTVDSDPEDFIPYSSPSGRMRATVCIRSPIVSNLPFDPIADSFGIALAYGIQNGGVGPLIPVTFSSLDNLQVEWLWALPGTLQHSQSSVVPGLTSRAYIDHTREVYSKSAVGATLTPDSVAIV